MTQLRSSPPALLSFDQVDQYCLLQSPVAMAAATEREFSVSLKTSSDKDRLLHEIEGS